MDFPTWFEAARLEAERLEGKCSANTMVVRIAAQAGVSLPVVRNALGGTRVSAPSARLLAAATGDVVEWHTLCDPGPVGSAPQNELAPPGDVARETNGD